jgi:23S rRNA (adenine2503-C2)-methyltransferase
MASIPLIRGNSTRAKGDTLSNMVDVAEKGTESQRETPRDLWIREHAKRSGFATQAEFMSAFGLKNYRLDQLYRGAVKELRSSPEELTVLPLELREGLAKADFRFSAVEPVTIQRSRDGQTHKGLFRLHDGPEVEAVLMQHHGERNTVCISSQAGCAFACQFCSTGQAGFTRQLTASEIFSQARYFARELAPQNRRITNIVFMGMGEPFHNYEAVMGAVSLLNDQQGFGLGHRHITISTVGLVPQIEQFLEEDIQVNLAISLHAPTDAQRSQIMPVNKRYPINELIAACDRYVERTNRKVFYEYIMLAGFNDDAPTARALGALMQRRLAHVNLIQYNATPNAPFQGSSDQAVREFKAIVEDFGVPVTVRHPMGRDIAAACGQLRALTQPRALDPNATIKPANAEAAHAE